MQSVDVDQYIERVDVAASSVPFPEPLPFDSVYIGFGEGIPLSKVSLMVRIPDKTRRDAVMFAVMLGLLLWQGPQGPMAVEVSYIIQKDGDNYHLPSPLTLKTGEW